MPTLTIVRGLPGSGKSTFAELTLKADIIHEADDWFLTPDGYEFCLQDLDKAHKFCQLNTEYDLKIGHDVVVCNVFSRSWEFEAYYHLFKQYNVQVYELQTNYGSIHNVPPETRKRMQDRWSTREQIEQELNFKFPYWKIIK